MSFTKFPSLSKFKNEFICFFFVNFNAWLVFFRYLFKQESSSFFNCDFINQFYISSSPIFFRGFISDAEVIKLLGVKQTVTNTEFEQKRKSSPKDQTHRNVLCFEEIAIKTMNSSRKILKIRVHWTHLPSELGSTLQDSDIPSLFRLRWSSLKNALNRLLIYSHPYQPPSHILKCF